MLESNISSATECQVSIISIIRSGSISSIRKLGSIISIIRSGSISSIRKLGSISSISLRMSVQHN